MADTYGLTGRDVARLLGKPESWVAQRRKLARHAGVLEAFVSASGTQDVETLTQLADLHGEDPAGFDALTASGRVSRADARRALRQARDQATVGPDAAAPCSPPPTRQEKPQEPLQALAEPDPFPSPGPPPDNATAALSGAADALSPEALAVLAHATVAIVAPASVRITLPGGRCVEMALRTEQVRAINATAPTRRAPQAPSPDARTSRRTR